MESIPPIDRRPIASRRWAIWTHLVNWLVRKKVTANAISVMGMVGGCFAGVVFSLTPYAGALEQVAWLLAAVFIQLRLIANLIDGMVAIESGQSSPVGEMFNEVPDRVSDSAILIGMGFAVGGQPLLGSLAALSAMFTAYVRAQGKAAGALNEFCGPMAKPHRMAICTLAGIAMAALPKSWQVEWHSMGLIALVLFVITVGSVFTAIRRLLRIGRQLRAKSR